MQVVRENVLVGGRALVASDENDYLIAEAKEEPSTRVPIINLYKFPPPSL